LPVTVVVSACRGEQALALTLRDATGATRIGQALRKSLASGLPVNLWGTARQHTYSVR